MNEMFLLKDLHEIANMQRRVINQIAKYLVYVKNNNKPFKLSDMGISTLDPLRELFESADNLDSIATGFCSETELQLLADLGHKKYRYKKVQHSVYFRLVKDIVFKYDGVDEWISI